MAVGFDFKKTININKCRKIDKNARGVILGVSSMLSRIPLVMSEICWRSGVPIEGEEAAMLDPIVDGVPWSEHYLVLRYCGAAVGKRKKVRGLRQGICQMTMSWLVVLV
jgi:hypothetical protein